jgi:predicted protein tyrosine phosphatase
MRLSKPKGLSSLAVPTKDFSEPDTEFVRKMEICEVLPNFLFLGDLADAFDKEALAAQRITYVLSLTIDAETMENEAICAHKIVAMTDSPDEDIGKHFDTCFNFIEKASASGGRVLIHCNMGVSRAPTIVIAFLMKNHNYSYPNALEYIKSKRPIVSPRLTFLFVLEAYEETLAAQCASCEELNCCGKRHSTDTADGPFEGTASSSPSGIDDVTFDDVLAHVAPVSWDMPSCGTVSPSWE